MAIPQTNSFNPTSVVDFPKQNASDANLHSHQIALRFPEKVDWIGVGPGAISVLSDSAFRSGYTFINPTGTDGYIKRVQLAQTSRVGTAIWSQFFSHQKADLELYWLSRQILSGRISSRRYSALFDGELTQDHHWACDTLKTHKLIKPFKDGYLLTAKGMAQPGTLIDVFSLRRQMEVKSG